MSLPVAVIDTNVVVSGILTAEPTAPTVRILDAMLKGRIAFLLSVDLLAEYQRVLIRPAISRRHGLSEVEISRVVAKLAQNGLICQPAEIAVALPDPGDAHLWALLATQETAVLVAGDAALRASPPARWKVLTPAAFAALLDAK
ncbi:MAG: putative toxin-antitoxin system toxin component, PIN family [Acidobacteriota bacterium]